MCIDFDYFYAQCEEIRRPELKELPVVVCVFSGRTEESGVVSTSNYIARKFGVKSGIAIKVAKSRLSLRDDAVFLPLDKKYYEAKSEDAMNVIKRYGDRYEYVGLDECFIDVTRVTEGSYDLATRIAQDIKNAVKVETNLTCTIGVAPNKLLAKVASDIQKPDGLTTVPPKLVKDFLSNLEVDKIPGVGPKTRKAMSEMGIITINQLSKYDLYALIEQFGKKTATYLHNASLGIDEETVDETAQARQIGRIVTLAIDSSQSAQMYDDIEELCVKVFTGLLDRKAAFKTVSILLILDDLENITRSKTLKLHSTNFADLSTAAKSLLDETMGNLNSERGNAGVRVRRLGVRLSNFKDAVGQNNILEFTNQN